MKIVIGEASDSFSIDIDDKHYYFNQEDTHEKLVEVFKVLGFKDVEYGEQM